MKFAKATHALRPLCRLGLPMEQFVPALLEAMHGVVPSHRNLFNWTDDRAQLVRYFFEGPIDARIAQLYFDKFHNQREAEAMPPFRALAELPAGVRGAQDLAHGHFHQSALYHEIWKPQGLHSRIEAVLRGRGGMLLGSLVLYRGHDDLAFTTEDEARLAHVLPDIADALTACGRARTDEPHLPAPAASETLLLSLDGQVCHTTSGAHALLLRCDGGVSRDRLSRPLTDLANGFLLGLLFQLRQQPKLLSAQQRLNVSHLTVAGPLQASATLLAPRQREADPLVQVMVRLMEPQCVALERALRLLPLTPGQITVCRELYNGVSQAEVATFLGVGQATVVDHVRKAYRSLDLRSTLELRALLDRHMLAGG